MDGWMDGWMDRVNCSFKLLTSF